MKEHIIDRINYSIAVKQQLLSDVHLIRQVETAVQRCTEAIQSDHAIWFCGNGGSAADSQHLAAEFSGRFYHDRDPYYSEALHVNTSYLTAVANDYSYEEVYARLIKAKAREGDLLFGLSTSGRSKNIVRAFEQARGQKVYCIAMTGSTGGDLLDLSDLCIRIPSDDTPRIQEAHMLLGHIICELTESALMQ